MPRRAPGQPALRIGSFNLRGLATPGRLQAAAAMWRAARYDVVFIQEHHLLSHLHDRATLQAVHNLGWQVFISFSKAGQRGAGRAGTAVLLRRALLSSGELAEPVVQHCARGRYTALSLTWSGHSLHLCSVYLPNDPSKRVRYISSTLAPLAAAAAAAGRQLVWGGDFNFTPDPGLDRRTLTRTPLRRSTCASDARSQSCFSLFLPHLVDVWRERRPTRRAFTHTNGSLFSRLDRIYVSRPLLPNASCPTVGRAPLADHCPVSLTLLGRHPPAVGHQRRRLRLGFLSSPALLQRLQEWLAEQAPPDDPHTLVSTWWPDFKRRLSSLCRELQRVATRPAAVVEEAMAALDSVARRWEAGDDAALPDLVVAHGRWRAAAHQAAVAAEAQLRRHTWLHAGERPNPAMTRQLRPPQHATSVAALRGAGGAMHTGAAAAQRAADFWAGVSAQPAVSPAAQAEVLAALSGGRRLAPELAATLGDAAFTEQEVLRAMRRAKPGRSPGLDGIPADLYCRLRHSFAPLFSRLFSAIAATGVLPPGFHEGLITIMHKSGDRSDPSNYRPITLLNTDYRLYTLLLARRLGPCLPHIIDPEQAAFVPGRRVGDNIMALQLLPHLLRRSGRWALAVFCDFFKAYDTIDREFLFSALSALGVGDAFNSLIRPLLTDTCARAVVNGFISGPASFLAGVRQGCPLAPLLYLCVAQALHAFLQARGIGIPDLLPCSQRTTTTGTYADDAQVLLETPAQIADFLSAMDTFAAATGQRLNPAKSRLLALGVVPPDLEAVLPPLAARRGLPLVDVATALGVPFSNGEPPADVLAAAWAERLAGVEATFTRISSLGLSLFGRGFASAGYGVSRLLYFAEFMGHPPAAVASRLQNITARLVDRARSPSVTGRAFAGLHHSALFGRPADGGFGVLPWDSHISARHAVWAVRLISAPLSARACPPWVRIARLLLHDLPPAGLLSWLPGRAVPGAMAPLPPPLRRLHAALGLLPPVVDVEATPLLPGSWCLSIPLWGNPALVSPSHPDGIDLPFADFLDAGVGTLAGLLSLERAVLAAPTQSAYTREVRYRLLGGSYAFAERHVASERVGQLLAALPEEWVAAARTAAAVPAPQPPPLDPAVVLAGMLLPRLGWRPPGCVAVPLSSLAVRAATSLLVAGAADARVARYLVPFAELAAGSAPPSPPPSPPPPPLPPSSPPLMELRATLRRLWRLPWENGRKETFWRLVYDALPTAARLHQDAPCQCGAAQQRPGRRHHFWECPVARSVVSQLQAARAVAAAPAPPPAPLALPHLWLARPPPGMHAGVWGIVCLAAVEAMAHGMRRLAGLVLRQQQRQQQPQPQPRYTQLTLDSFLLPGGVGAPPPPPPPLPNPAHAGPAAPDPDDPSQFISVASRCACKYFWTLLSDFVALGCAPASWSESLPPSHPFFRVVGGRLQLRPLPLGVAGY